MPTVSATNFNIIVSFLGGFISLFGLVSYLLKENFYMSEALISLLAGVTFSPHVVDLIRPLDYALGSEENLNDITLYFSRLVLGVQLVLAGVQLPSRYLHKQWKPLSILLGPVMACMWLVTSLLIWGLVPNIPLVHALAIGSCVTPTDPVLSNVIVKGKFADGNVPKQLQKIIIAESGANDGLGYPFLFLALYLIQYVGDGGRAESGGVGRAMGLWFSETWGYTILLSVVYGAMVGYIAKELLHFAERRKWVDRESFLVFAISLALFITGTCGLIGSDDVLACFIAGNSFTWDDWFRLETLDEYAFRYRLPYSLQPTIDMLLNVTIFLWYGAVCPWQLFAHNNVISLGRLFALGVLILLLRRLPAVLLWQKFIPQLENKRQTAFMGFFGPVGVSGIFYLYVTLEFLDTLKQGGQQREDVANMGEAVTVIVWFIAMCSVVVHGLSIPLGKFGVYLPRTISRTLSSDNRDDSPSRAASRSASRPRNSSEQHTPPMEMAPAPASGHQRIFRIGGSVIQDDKGRHELQAPAAHVGTTGGVEKMAAASGPPRPTSHDMAPSPPTVPTRTIRFPDDDDDDEGHDAGGSRKPSLERGRPYVLSGLPGATHRS